MRPFGLDAASWAPDLTLRAGSCRSLRLARRSLMRRKWASGFCLIVLAHRSEGAELVERVSGAR